MPAQPHGSSSGAGFGFWHLSARVGTRRLGRFRYRRRLICVKSMRRTMLIGAINPPASPAIGQICGVLCMQVDEQSELETHAGEDRAAESDKYMPEGACRASNSCCMGRGCPSSSPIAAAMAFADPLHPMKRFPRAPWACRRVEISYCIDMSHVRTESDLGKLEISSMLCIH